MSSSRHSLKPLGILTAIFVLILLALIATRAPAKQSAPANLVAVPVTHVVDGDTFDISLNGQTERVRIEGIDTPETVKPNTPVQCYGPEASAEAKRIQTNQSVVLTSDPVAGDKDEYGRILRYVTLPDGSDYCEHMIRQGFAREYDFNGQAYAKRSMYEAAQTDAQMNHRGLWSPTTCNGGR